MSQSDESIREEILKQISTARSVAPREVALALASEGEDWRKFLPRIRSAATILSQEGLLLFIRKKKIVPPEGLRGVFRLASPERYGQDES